MFRFWKPVIEPIMKTIIVNHIVEIGSDNGFNTANLLEFCERNNSFLHVIDPNPKYDTDEWKERHPGLIKFYKSLSLEALPLIDEMDAVMIDGDHNWYTVYHELLLIKQCARKKKKRFPIIFFHDACWPYARRDMYYDPETIPEGFKQPHKKLGLMPDKKELIASGGLNQHLYNAVNEGGDKNGVLTAVEDFIANSKAKLHFKTIPIWHGLGILYSENLLANNEFTSKIESISVPDCQAELLEKVEHERISDIIENSKIKAKHAHLLKERDSAIAAIKERTARDVAQLKKQITDQDCQIDDQQHKINDLNNKIKDLNNKIKKGSIAITDIDKQKRLYASGIKELQINFDALLHSRRWKMGNFLGDCLGLLTFQKKQAAAVLNIQEIISGLRKIDKKREKKNKLRLQNFKLEKCSLEQVSGLKADVIICICNALDDVKRCIESVTRNTDLNRHRLILVDDGSDKDTAEFIRSSAQTLNAVHIRNKQRRGYCIAANQGLRIVGGDYAVLLNSDTIVPPLWVERLMVCACSNESTGVVGPLSNAASWQSIPKVLDDNGSWIVNELPIGESVDSFAAKLTEKSASLYPGVSFVNGFCYMISREALNSVGFLDEASFPQGYGEEDDFSIRCRDAGFGLYIADDAYIYHAKSKSFGVEGRAQIVTNSKKRLAEKHGRDRIQALVQDMQHNEQYIKATHWLKTNLEKKPPAIDTGRLSDYAPRIGWLQPHLNCVGGIRRAIEMTNRLKQWGTAAYLITPDGIRPNWLPCQSEVVTVNDAQKMTFDVLIISDPEMVDAFDSISSHVRICYHLAAYMIYRQKNSNLERYYSLPGDVGHAANSSWTAEQVTDYCGAEVKNIFPGGIDFNLFHPVRTNVAVDIVCYGSKRIHKGSSDIVTASKGLQLLKLADIDPAQNQLADLISSGRIFVSACYHEGFNFCPLEAMACGVPVVMTDCGGSREYARNGENAIVVPPKDIAAMRDAIDTLLNDSDLRLKLIKNGFETVMNFNWDQVTSDFAIFLSTKLKESAGTTVN